MSRLKQDIARRERQILLDRQRFQAQRHEIADSVHARLTSRHTLGGGFAVGFALALLRCRGRRRAAPTFAPEGAPLKSLQWLLRTLGPPIIMTLLHRYAGQPDSEELQGFGDITD